MTLVVPELLPSPGFCDSAFGYVQNDTWGLNRLSFSGLTRESTLPHTHMDTRVKREYDTGGSELLPSPGFCDSAYASAQNDISLYLLYTRFSQFQTLFYNIFLR
jgi:hypothetical protein